MIMLETNIYIGYSILVSERGPLPDSVSYGISGPSDRKVLRERKAKTKKITSDGTSRAGNIA